MLAGLGLLGVMSRRKAIAKLDHPRNGNNSPVLAKKARCSLNESGLFCSILAKNLFPAILPWLTHAPVGDALSAPAQSKRDHLPPASLAR